MVIQPSGLFPRVQASSPLSTPEEIPYGRKKSPAVRVLVVDDEPLVLWSITETLRSHGMEVDEARNAKEALRAITREGGPPDAVLLDLNLPDSHDLGLLRTMRTIAPATRVFLMTAFGTPEVRLDAQQLGVVDVIDKPFDLTRLDSILTCRP
jgi:DNA-binding NtrC family response regulator